MSKTIESRYMRQLSKWANNGKDGGRVRLFRHQAEKLKSRGFKVNPDPQDVNASSATGMRFYDVSFNDVPDGSVASHYKKMALDNRERKRMQKERHISKREARTAKRVLRNEGLKAEFGEPLPPEPEALDDAE